MSEEYKSLRSIIFEVQSTAAPKPSAPAQTPAKPSRHKPGEVWKIASGFGAMNKKGQKDYRRWSEDEAKRWAQGTEAPSGEDQSKMDTSQEVELDKDGNEKNLFRSSLLFKRGRFPELNSLANYCNYIQC
jgi:hypothetical protein